MVFPSCAWWSKSIEVIAVAIGATTFVASSRPPRPTSRTAISTDARRNNSKAAAVATSKNVGNASRTARLHQRVDRFLHGAERVTEIRGGDLLSVYDEPLFEADEMGRRVSSGAETRRAECRLGHHRDRPLAVRAGDDDRSECALGMSQLGAQCRDVLEPELHAEPFEAVKKVDGVRH